MISALRYTLSFVVLLSLLGVQSALAAQPGIPGGTRQSVVVPGRYIVVLRDDVPSAAAVARDLAARHGVAVSHVYEAALKGFAADVPAGRLLALQLDPRVSFVEPDQTAHTFAQLAPTGVQRIFATSNTNLGINETDEYRIDVDVAVIDTGIAEHPDLDVVRRANCTGGGPLKASCADNAGTDGNGHGTHVAGTIGALDNGIGVVGVAPGARLWSVKVLDNSGSGYISWIVAGIDWVTRNRADIEVANMSLGCECSSSALDTAITNSVAAGIVYVVAAGNSNKDARTFSPANHPDVITVSALADFDGEPGGLAGPTCRTDEDDTLAAFSNWGPRIDIAAPGVCILSTWHNGSGYNTISGTSMAAPHVAGAAALLASGDKPTDRSGVLAIRKKLRDSGNVQWTDDSGDDVKEPLLDVSNMAVFEPAMTSGSGVEPDPGSTDGNTGTTNGMGVYQISRSGAKHLDVTVNIRRDSHGGDGGNGDGSLTSSDAVVAGAGVALVLTRNASANGNQECSSADDCWQFAGNSDTSGNFRVKLLHAPPGYYHVHVTSIKASGLTWDPGLDNGNPADFQR